MSDENVLKFKPKPKPLHPRVDIESDVLAVMDWLAMRGWEYDYKERVYIKKNGDNTYYVEINFGLEE